VAAQVVPGVQVVAIDEVQFLDEGIVDVIILPKVGQDHFGESYDDVPYCR
jgi:thymidine kinase